MTEHDSQPPYQGRGELHRGDERSSPYPVSRLSPAFGLVDLAREIDHADAMVSNRTSAKLQLIAEQIRHLQAQARQVLEEARHDKDLHHARCSFQRHPGRIYHLYRLPDGNTQWSLLSPADWHGQPPHVFLGSYQLELDQSWTPTAEIGRSDDSRQVVKRLLETLEPQEKQPST